MATGQHTDPGEYAGKSALIAPPIKKQDRSKAKKVKKDKVEK